MSDMTSYAVLATPFGRIGVTAMDTEQGAVLSHLHFLPPDTVLQPALHPLLKETERQLAAYFADPALVFDLPYTLSGTQHQLKVWRAIAAIRCGEVQSYSLIAKLIASSPRAIGGACGRNPLPIIIPCHRVVAAQGLGGFNAGRDGSDWLPVKRWLLRHEGVVYGD